MQWSIWIILVVGAIIAYVLPYLIKFATFALTHPFREKLLEGVWYTYHFTRIHGQMCVRYEQWTIKRNYMNKLVLRTHDPNRPDLKYQGRVDVERNFLIVTLNGIKHKEKLHLRFFNIIPTGQDRMFGLAMGVDFHNRPISIGWLASRSEMTEEEARDVLVSKLKVDRSHKVLSIED